MYKQRHKQTAALSPAMNLVKPYSVIGRPSGCPIQTSCGLSSGRISRGDLRVSLSVMTQRLS